MILENDAKEHVCQAFESLAALVNQLPAEQRAELRSTLGSYTHDLKHTLGLVTGANGILLRLNLGEEAAAEVQEMAGIITNASVQMDALIMLLVEHLNNQIKAGS